MKVAVHITKNVLAPLGVTAAASAIDAGIRKKIHCSGTTTLMKKRKILKKLFKIFKILIFY